MEERKNEAMTHICNTKKQVEPQKSLIKNYSLDSL